MTKWAQRKWGPSGGFQRSALQPIFGSALHAPSPIFSSALQAPARIKNWRSTFHLYFYLALRALHHPPDSPHRLRGRVRVKFKINKSQLKVPARLDRNILVLQKKKRAGRKWPKNSFLTINFRQKLRIVIIYISLKQPYLMEKSENYYKCDSRKFMLRKRD